MLLPSISYKDHAFLGLIMHFSLVGNADIHKYCFFPELLKLLNSTATCYMDCLMWLSMNPFYHNLAAPYQC